MPLAEKTRHLEHDQTGARISGRRILFYGLFVSLLLLLLYDHGSKHASRVLRGGGRAEDPLVHVLERARDLELRTSAFLNAGHIADAVRAACRRHGFDEHPEQKLLVLAIISVESGGRVRPRYAPTLPFLVKNSSDTTLGPMRARAFTLAERQVMDSLEGGIDLAVRRLARTWQNYREWSEKPRDLIGWTAADYQAGPFASRNAGLQRILRETRAGGKEAPLIDGALLALVPSEDGDTRKVVIRYGDEELVASREASETEQVLLELSRLHDGPEADHVRRDLLRMRQAHLIHTKTWEFVAGFGTFEPIIPIDAYEHRFRALVPANNSVRHRLVPFFELATGLSFSTPNYVERLRDRIRRYNEWIQAMPAGPLASTIASE